MNAPEISVVMATRNAAAYVEQALESLAGQEAAPETEIIVADSSSDGTGHIIRSRFPKVRLLECNRSAPTPALLLDALRAAEGRIIVLTEPYCRFPSDWLQGLRRAHDSEFAVIGGAVACADSAGLVDWACYFADYGAFLPAAPKRETPVLAGNHVSYKREVVAQALGSMPDGFRKTFFHWDLGRQGARFLFDPELVIHWERRNGFGECMRRFFCNGRDFAVTRSKRIPQSERVLRLLTAPALPALLLYRRLRPVISQRGYTARVFLALPLVAAFVVVWSAGEFLGYLDDPGRAPQAEVD